MVIAAANLFRPLKRKKTSLVKLGRLKLSKFFSERWDDVGL